MSAGPWCKLSYVTLAIDESAGKGFAAGDVAANELMLRVEVTAVELATGFEVADRFLGRVEVARASDLATERAGRQLLQVAL